MLRPPTRTAREYIRRICAISQMDFQFTFAQMMNLCISPDDVYKTTKVRKQIKNQWARDDPAFVVLMIVLMLLSSLAWSLAFGFQSASHFFRLVAGSVIFEFIGVGLIVATTLRTVANRYMRVVRPLSTEQSVEWLYSFDIHCNGFFPLFLILFVGQYFVSPWLLSDNFFIILLGNALYGVAFSYYWYITFLGYSALPFLQHTERFLWPIGALAIVFFTLTAFRINVAHWVLSAYFGA